MKKQIPSINMFNKLKKAVFIAATFISSNSFAQNFEGKVTYEVSFPGLEVPAEQKAMMPKEMLMYCKGSNSRTELSMGMGMIQTTISNGKNKESIVLMDMMGNIAIKFTEADEKKKAGEIIPDVKITEETKTIAGYKCKKAIVTLKEENIVMPIWFTEEINTYNSQWESMYKGIKGMIMEYEYEFHNGMDMKMTAKSVNKEAVADSKFVVPEGYKQMTMDEFQKSLEFGE